MSLPILYSFRRCPYAMRGRLAISRANLKVELREILLRDKAPEFLEISPKGTVPVLLLPDGRVIEESLEVMDWALKNEGIHPEHRNLVVRSDEEFKPWLDRYKYPNRYEDSNVETAVKNASKFLFELNHRLSNQPFLFGQERGFADLGILPFVRQFAHVNKNWFLDQSWGNLIEWYHAFVAWDGYQNIMKKYQKWEHGDTALYFP